MGKQTQKSGDFSTNIQAEHIGDTYYTYHFGEQARLDRQHPEGLELKPNYGSVYRDFKRGAYRAIVSAHEPIAKQFPLIVFEISVLVICSVGLYLSYDYSRALAFPILSVLRSLTFYLLGGLALHTVLLIIRLHLRIRYENALLAQKHGD
jgi:hypothetical protein